jgi:hypothetical protein
LAPRKNCKNPRRRDCNERSGETMANAAKRVWRGVAGALRAHPGIFAAVAAGILALYMLLPPALLSLARKPFDFFTFNPWLAELPHYLVRGDVPIQRKLEFIPNLAIFWWSADGAYGEVDWGFAITVGDLARLVVLSLLFGAYFALVLRSRDLALVRGRDAALGRGGGLSGALASVLGISTGGCTVMGCGAPVIPVVGLAFAGLSSGALALLARVSNVATAFVLVALLAGIVYLAWRTGEAA